MKTFKLVSLHVEANDTVKEIQLEDGLIINKEDERSNWLIEAYADDEQHDYFQELKDQDTELTAHAVITKKENDPAFFQMKVLSVKRLNGHVSVLLEGVLKRMRSDYAELLLADLISKGLSGEELQADFKEKMKTRPVLANKK